MRLARTLALLVLPCLVITSGCDDEKKDAGAAEGSPAAKAGEAGGAEAGTCTQAHGEEIEAEMLSWCELSDKGISPDIPLAPWTPAPTDKPRGGRIELRPGGLQAGWGREAKVEELVELLEQERKSVQMQGKTMSGWSLTIDADTPRAEVAAVIGTLADAGQRTGTVVLSVEPSAPIPEPRDAERLAAIHAKVDGAEPSQRATILAKEIEQAMPPCKELVEVFRAIATVAADQRCTLMAKGFAEGLVSCKCPKEDELLTLIYAVSLGTTPPQRLSTTVPVTLDPSAAPRPGATWGEIVAGIDEAAMKGLWID